MEQAYHELLLQKAAEGNSFAKGTLFEHYTARLFPDEYFSIVH